MLLSVDQASIGTIFVRADSCRLRILELYPKTGLLKTGLLGSTAV